MEYRRKATRFEYGGRWCVEEMWLLEHWLCKVVETKVVDGGGEDISEASESAKQWTYDNVVVSGGIEFVWQQGSQSCLAIAATTSAATCDRTYVFGPLKTSKL